MNEVQTALAGALEAQRQGSAALATALEQLQALVTSRGETATKLQDAKASLKDASAALAKGGSEKAFHTAMDQVALLEARCRAFDEIAIPEAQSVIVAAEAALPCARHLAALQLRVRVQTDLVPLYEQHAALMAAQAEILAKVEEAHASLRQEFRGVHAKLFGADPRSAVEDLLKSVPPVVRRFSRHIFTDLSMAPVFEDRFLSHDAQALEKFKARIDREPSESDLATPPPSEPRPEPGPAKMRGYTISTPRGS